MQNTQAMQDGEASAVQSYAKLRSAVLCRNEDDARAELEQEGREAERIREWWSTPRFANIRRPYTAEQVIALRGTAALFAQKQLNIQGTAQPTLYPYSAAIAKKAFTVLDAHQKAGTASVTFGSLDPIQVANMASYLDTVYVSGRQCSSTAASSNEPGPDLADYPYDTVPKKVCPSCPVPRPLPHPHSSHYAQPATHASTRDRLLLCSCTLFCLSASCTEIGAGGAPLTFGSLCRERDCCSRTSVVNRGTL